MGPKDQIKVQNKKRGCLTWYTSIYKKKKKLLSMFIKMSTIVMFVKTSYMMS